MIPLAVENLPPVLERLLVSRGSRLRPGVALVAKTDRVLHRWSSLGSLRSGLPAAGHAPVVSGCVDAAGGRARASAVADSVAAGAVRWERRAFMGHSAASLGQRCCAAWCGNEPLDMERARRGCRHYGVADSWDGSDVASAGHPVPRVGRDRVCISTASPGCSGWKRSWFQLPLRLLLRRSVRRYMTREPMWVGFVLAVVGRHGLSLQPHDAGLSALILKRSISRRRSRCWCRLASSPWAIPVGFLLAVKKRLAILPAPLSGVARHGELLPDFRRPVHPVDPGIPRMGTSAKTKHRTLRAPTDGRLRMATANHD
jgi:hypothetical protein